MMRLNSANHPYLIFTVKRQHVLIGLKFFFSLFSFLFTLSACNVVASKVPRNESLLVTERSILEFGLILFGDIDVQISGFKGKDYWQCRRSTTMVQQSRDDPDQSRYYTTNRVS